MTIAILAHDSRKDWRCSSAQLTAASYPATQSCTGTTGRMLAQATGLPYTATSPGSWAASSRSRPGWPADEVDLVLFFRDPLKAEAGSSSEQNLLRLCDMHSVPISTNIATAEVLLRGLDQGDLDYREGIHPDIVEPLPVHRAVC